MNHYVVHLKLIYCKSTIPQLKKNKMSVLPKLIDRCNPSKIFGENTKNLEEPTVLK